MLKKVCNTMLIIEGQRIRRVEGGWETYQKSHSHEGEAGGSDHARDNQEIQEETLLLETRLSYWLGEISRYKPTQAEYEKADLEIKELMKRKKELS